MTYLELVRRYPPDVTEAEANLILWEQTAFPMCGVEHVERQLAALALEVDPSRDGWRERVDEHRQRGYAEMARLSELGPDEDA